MTNTKDKPIIIEVVNKVDVDRINMFRMQIQKSGGKAGYLNTPKVKNTNKSIDAINMWVSRNKKVRDIYKTAWTLLLTLNTTQWKQLSLNAGNYTQVNSILNRQLNKRTEIGASLWVFTETQRTADQIASGIVLAEWDATTQRAWFQNQNEIAHTYRG